jgi:hypothetical protein
VTHSQATFARLPFGQIPAIEDDEDPKLIEAYEALGQPPRSRSGFTGVPCDQYTSSAHLARRRGPLDALFP